MLSTPIFEQLCRELAGSAEPGEVRVEAAEAGANNQKSTTCPKPDSDAGLKPEADSAVEPEPIPGSDAEPDAEPEFAAEPEPEAELESADESEPEAGRTAPDERVA